MLYLYQVYVLLNDHQQHLMIVQYFCDSQDQVKIHDDLVQYLQVVQYYRVRLFVIFGYFQQFLTIAQVAINHYQFVANFFEYIMDMLNEHHHCKN